MRKKILTLCAGYGVLLCVIGFVCAFSQLFNMLYYLKDTEAVVESVKIDDSDSHLQLRYTVDDRDYSCSTSKEGVVNKGDKISMRYCMFNPKDYTFKRVDFDKSGYCIFCGLMFLGIMLYCVVTGSDCERE